MAARPITFLFPGQGSQHPGMGRDLHQAYAESRLVFEEADQVLGFALTRLCFEGPESDLTLTENTQPAILTVSIAAWRALAARGIEPMAVAGHSLGEYSALVAAGSLRFADALRLVRERGRFMQEAVPVGEGAMAAILGLEPAAVEAVCLEAARGQVVEAANFNSPEQTVVAGHGDAVRRAVALAEARGAKRALMLPVSAPFHCRLMEPARARLEPLLEKVEFADLRVPLVTNVEAKAITRGEQARAALGQQVTAAVRWTDSVRALRAAGAEVAIEVGPGRVLGGLVRRIERAMELANVEDPKSLDKTLEQMRGGA